MKQSFLFLALVLLSSSCASIINGNRSNVNIRTSRATNLVIEGDTLYRDTNETVYLRVENDRSPLRVTTFDSLGSKPLYIGSKTSGTYWLNGFTAPVFFAGFLVDEITGMKRRYPRNVYIDVDGINNSYLPYFPMDSSLLQHKNKITFAPVSIIHQYHPAYEFGYERLHKNNFATQVSLGVFRSWDNNYARNSKGVKVSIEEKYFFRSQSNTRFYVGFTFEHHNKTHDADLRFVSLNNQGDPIWETGRFTQRTTVEKRFFAYTPRIGLQTYIAPRLIAEGFFGIGLRHRNVKHRNISPNVRHTGDDWLWFDIETDSNWPGRQVSSNWDLNFRIGWVF